MDTCMPLQTETNGMARGIPEHRLITLDGMLNNLPKNQSKSHNTPTGASLEQSTKLVDK